MPISTALIRRYYNRVIKHLKGTGVWSRVVSLLGKGSEGRATLEVWHAVRDILERLEEHGIDPEELDWETLFENIVDFESRGMFLDYLESQGYIPVHRAEREAESIYEEATRILRELRVQYEKRVGELKELARALTPELAREIRMKLPLLVPKAEYEELKKRIRDMNKRIRELERLDYVSQAMRLRGKAEELERELERVKKEYSELHRRYEELAKKPPEIPPLEVRDVATFKKFIPKVKKYFEAALMERGVSPTTAKRYYPLLERRVIDLVISDLEEGIPYKWVDIERMIDALADEIVYIRPPTPRPRRMYPPFERYGVEVTTREREEYFSEFLRELGVDWDWYKALDAFTKAELEKDFIRWLSKKKGI